MGIKIKRMKSTKLSLICFTLLFLTTTAHSQVSDSISQVISSKVENALDDYYKGNPETYGMLFSNNAVYYDFGEAVIGKQNIINRLRGYPINDTKHEVLFSPVDKISEDTYVVNYIIKEETGFIVESTEVWTLTNGDIEIVYARLPHPMLFEQQGGPAISVRTFVLSVIGFGLFLFLLFVIISNAYKYKSKNQ